MGTSGFKFSEESKEKMSRAKLGKKLGPHSAEHKQRIANSLTGRKRTEEDCIKMSKAQIKLLRETNKGKRYTHKNSGIMMRSEWEIEVANILDNKEIIWEYESEKCVHELVNGRHYLIDFYLPTHDMFIEVKGYNDDYTRQKYFEAIKTKRILLVDKKNIKIFIEELL